MSTSAQLRAVLDAIPRDFAAPEAGYLAVRKMFAPFHGHPVGEDFQVTMTELGGVRCGSYALAGTASDLVAFHCHGGALVSTPVDQYHFYAEIIARQLGCEVIMPDYRLAPEHPYPAAHDDCFHAYRGLLQSGRDPRSIVVMGESCGGALAVGALLRARDAGLPMPLCFVSLTGWFDLSVAGPAVPGRDPFLTPEWVRNRGRDYVGGHMALDDPQVSPAYADLAGLPPLYLQIGECDTMRRGAERLAASARAVGVAVTEEAWPGMVQGWQGLVTAGVPEATAAWSAIRDYVLQQAGRR